MLCVWRYGARNEKTAPKSLMQKKVQRPTPVEPTDQDKTCFLPGGRGNVRLREEEGEKGEKKERTKGKGAGHDEHAGREKEGCLLPHPKGFTSCPRP